MGIKQEKIYVSTYPIPFDAKIVDYTDCCSILEYINELKILNVWL